MKDVYIVTLTDNNFNVHQSPIRFRSKERALSVAKNWCKTQRDASVIKWGKNLDGSFSEIVWLSTVDNK